MAEQQRSWSFNQPVLLRKRRQASSLLVWSGVAATAGGVLWMVVAPLQETIAVQGKLQPIGQVRVIRAPAPGVVEQVLVRDGAEVTPGQLLVQMDLRQARQQLDSGRSVLERLQNENRIYQAALGEEPAAGLTANQRLALQKQRELLIGRREASAQELLRARTRVASLERSLKASDEIARRYRSLVGSGALSAVALIDVQERADQQRSDLQEAQAELKRVEAMGNAGEASGELELRNRIEANLRQIAALQQQVSDAKRLISLSQLRAPVAGVAFDVSVTPGAVLADSAKPILKVVPQQQLQARVYLPNAAIGFVQPGQKALVSLDSFPAADYGRIGAKVVAVGSDALPPEQQREVLGTEVRGLFFPATLQLDRQSLQAGRRSIPLTAGMSLTADLQLRERRFISLFTAFFDDKLKSLERMR
ncbi:HlyD family efflux transporter periplasmic adaptor subunit [Synechococcus sp. CBW1107]|uniref:HlyD family efflux transporter periplasmic adaptor subunit n=1 Tax=Synechococcus sp. CBW1107 TaxID=2789857 RepID=UPI002AD45598|nr:HlyD family efflux transporter periplasmic adaptor subunit [Synechococcus sp. CBW1107]CAK6687268.1 Leukotoxin export protein LtxD [Synechococcus sp. CBW1107]